VLAIRAIVLFPAVAVDAPGANWLQEIADTGGHTWRIFFIILMAMLPLFIVNIILAVVVGSAATPIPGLLAITFLWYPLAILLAYTLAAVIASRLYQWIGVRVKGVGADDVRVAT
jgi:hypothetical protein